VSYLELCINGNSMVVFLARETIPYTFAVYKMEKRRKVVICHKVAKRAVFVRSLALFGEFYPNISAVLAMV
jgi:hypothetical protein